MNSNELFESYVNVKWGVICYPLDDSCSLESRLAKCHHSHHPGCCKIFRGWVKFVTELTMFCRKFNLLSLFFICWGVKVLRNVGNVTFRVFCNEIIAYFHSIWMIWSLSIVFFSFFCFVANLVLLKLHTFWSKNQVPLDTNSPPITVVWYKLVHNILVLVYS